MTSKERVEAVFAGEIPDKVPRWCGASPEFWEKAKKERAVAKVAAKAPKEGKEKNAPKAKAKAKAKTATLSHLTK